MWLQRQQRTLLGTYTNPPTSQSSPLLAVCYVMALITPSQYRWLLWWLCLTLPNSVSHERGGPLISANMSYFCVCVCLCACGTGRTEEIKYKCMQKRKGNTYQPGMVCMAGPSHVISLIDSLLHYNEAKSLQWISRNAFLSFFFCKRQVEHLTKACDLLVLWRVGLGGMEVRCSDVVNL